MDSEGIIRVLPNIRTGTDGYTWGKPWKKSEILQSLGIVSKDGNVLDGEKFERIFTDGLNQNEVVAELWLGSDDRQYPTTVTWGKASFTLHELLADRAKDILGQRHMQKYGCYMASIMKIIDAEDALSAQLHSAKLISRDGKHVPPKPEMWMYFKDGGSIYLGWSQDISEEKLKRIYSHSRCDLKRYDRDCPPKELSKTTIERDKNGAVCSIAVTKTNGERRAYLQKTDGVHLTINENEKYFYSDACLDLTCEQKKTGNPYCEILLLRSLFEPLLNKVILTPDKFLVVRGGLVHAIRGGTTLIEFSIAPSKEHEGMGGLKDATLAFSDSLDGKRPRHDKENLAFCIDIFNQEPKNWQKTDLNDPTGVISRPILLEEREGGKIEQLFSAKTGVVVERLTISKHLRQETAKHGYSVFVLEGSVKVQSDHGCERLEKNECAIIPACLGEYTLSNESNLPTATMLRWHAAL